MRHFMDRHNLTVSQQNRVMEYMKHLWSKYQYVYLVPFLQQMYKVLCHGYGFNLSYILSYISINEQFRNMFIN